MPKLTPMINQEVFTHRFPSDMRPGKVLSVNVGGVKKGLLDTSSPIAKPFKRPKQERESRSTLVEMEFEQSVIVQELRINFGTGEISVVGRLDSVLFLNSQSLVPSKTTLTTYFEGKRRKKVLHSYFQGSGQPFLSIDRVFGLYDRVYCVDTNTATGRDGSKVAVTTAITVTSEQVGDVGVHISSDHTIELVAIDPPAGNPELHGIWMLLARLWENHPHLLQGRLAIITDTELGKIKAWNERIEPFYDGHMLPGGIDIFYASADVGSEEFLPNRLMKACDSLSTQKLQQMR